MTLVVSQETTGLYTIFHDGDIVLASEFEQCVLQQGHAKQVLAQHQVALGNFLLINGPMIDRPIIGIQIHFVILHFRVGNGTQETKKGSEMDRAGRNTDLALAGTVLGLVQQTLNGQMKNGTTRMCHHDLIFSILVGQSQHLSQIRLDGLQYLGALHKASLDKTPKIDREDGEHVNIDTVSCHFHSAKQGNNKVPMFTEQCRQANEANDRHDVVFQHFQRNLQRIFSSTVALMTANGLSVNPRRVDEG
mmetsp:Transcript_24638/g.46863  ORF Transcript_24638/g.46863 Transcript_24638/m.46863 type:complete len:248 (-) Transcript_24638:106-849(-)